MSLYYQHILTYDGVSKILENEPAGWQDFSRRYYRSETYKGVLRGDAINQRFVLNGGAFDWGGYYFIKDAYDAEGIKASILYERKIKNPYTNQYNDDYSALLDLTPASGFSIEDEWIEVKFIDSRKLQDFVSNDEKNISLSATEALNGNAITPFVSAPRSILYPAVDLLLYAETEGSVIADDQNITTPIDETNYYLGTTNINLVGERLTFTDDFYTNSSGDSIDLTIEIKGDYDVTYTSTPLVSGANNTTNAFVIYTRIIASDGFTVLQEYRYIEDISTYVDITNAQTDNFTGSVDTIHTYSIPDGSTVKLGVRWIVDPITAMDVRFQCDFTDVEYNVVETYAGSDENIDTWLSHELATRAIQIITGETDTSKLIYSEALGRTDSEFTTYSVNGGSSLIGTVGGLVLRQFPDGLTKIAFRDWFKSISRIQNLALWYDRINDYFRIEELEQVYKDVQIYDLGEVKNLKIRPSKHYSKLLTGTKEKGDYEELQGILEYNIMSEHSANFPVNDQLDLRPTYNTDGMGIVFALRNPYRRSGITDTKQDDKVYLIDTNGTSALQFADATGFRGITDRYNGNFEPRRCVLRNGNWISGLFWKDASGVIKFVNNVKDIEIKYGYGNITSTDDIQESELAMPLFYPEECECEFTVDYDLIQQLESDPHGYFRLENKYGEESFWYIHPEGQIEINDHKKTGTGLFIRANINR